MLIITVPYANFEVKRAEDGQKNKQKNVSYECILEFLFASICESRCSRFVNKVNKLISMYPFLYPMYSIINYVQPLGNLLCVRIFITKYVYVRTL
jgi:hypothetical protein